MTSGSHDEPTWLTEIQVRMLHAEAVRMFGGSHGIRDQSLLERALGRPQNMWAYQESASLPELAASYGFGIAKNHAFVDGNKRTSLLAIRAFLFRNGLHFQPAEVESVSLIEGLAAGSVTEEALANWIAENSTTSQPPPSSTG